MVEATVEAVRMYEVRSCFNNAPTVVRSHPARIQEFHDVVFSKTACSNSPPRMFKKSMSELASCAVSFLTVLSSSESKLGRLRSPNLSKSKNSVLVKSDSSSSRLYES